MKNPSFHKDFKLNDFSFETEAALLNYAKSFNNSIFNFLTDWFNHQDFVVVQTSGSTGAPKPIELQKEFMVNSAIATGNFFKIKENTKALLCLSTDYIAGKMMLVRALTLGWHLDVVAPVSNPLSKTDKTYDFSAMVPLQLRNSLNELNKVKQLIVGGGVVANDLIAEIQPIKTKVFATYGMTETITHIAVKKLNNFNAITNEASNYITLPDVTISLDSRSCLVINAPKVSLAEIITNDVVSLVSEKSFTWLGRYDNVINSGGVKLHPEKIEEKLTPIIKNRFFVIGVSDKILGEKLILIVESLKIDDNLKSEISNLKSLDKFEIPKMIYFVESFVETETKKIQRKKTLDLVLNII
ncbi:MAG: AMP-binding protein [Tenacibaculum sp.]